MSPLKSLILSLLFITFWIAAATVIGFTHYRSLPVILPLQHLIMGGPFELYVKKLKFFKLMYGVIYGLTFLILAIGFAFHKVPRKWFFHAKFWQRNPEIFRKYITKMKLWLYWLSGIVCQLSSSFFIIVIYSQIHPHAALNLLFLSFGLFLFEFVILIWGILSIRSLIRNDVVKAI
jgi:hypothetical protein